MRQVLAVDQNHRTLLSLDRTLPGRRRRCYAHRRSSSAGDAFLWVVLSMGTFVLLFNNARTAAKRALPSSSILHGREAPAVEGAPPRPRSRRSDEFWSWSSAGSTTQKATSR